MFKAKQIPSHQIKDNAILAVDVDYRDGYAIAAGVLFQDWDSVECAVITARIDDVQPYEPGAFYKRELPCILELLKHIKIKLGCIIVDGFVRLGADQHDGLGAYVHHVTQIPVVGVAKTYFEETPDLTKVFRGGSKKPLYVTSIGGDEEMARLVVEVMAGDHRIPGMLKYVDYICRNQDLRPFSCVHTQQPVV
ncbi:endonuclease V [Acinetobacter sp.]|uniref:endonuclease V n=1 Tax=Acinetobacter sp. TaxID=472 RepID=UPI00388D71CD